MILAISTFSAGRRTQRTAVPSLSNVRNWRFGVSVPWVQRVNFATTVVPMAVGRFGNWVRRVNEELGDKELDAVSLVDPAWQLRLDAKIGGVRSPSGLGLESHSGHADAREKKQYQAINEERSS